MSDERKNQLSTVEPAEAVSVVAARDVLTTTSKPDARRRRRVSKDEAREIGRLYSETSTPTSRSASDLVSEILYARVPQCTRVAADESRYSQKSPIPIARGSPR